MAPPALSILAPCETLFTWRFRLGFSFAPGDSLYPGASDSPSSSLPEARGVGRLFPGALRHALYLALPTPLPRKGASKWSRGACRKRGLVASSMFNKRGAPAQPAGAPLGVSVAQCKKRRAGRRGLDLLVFISAMQPSPSRACQPRGRDTALSVRCRSRN